MPCPTQIAGDRFAAMDADEYDEHDFEEEYPFDGESPRKDEESAVQNSAAQESAHSQALSAEESVLSQEPAYDAPVRCSLSVDINYVARCLRVTTVDIMCTSTTSTSHKLPPVKGVAKKAVKASLPYKTPDVLPAFSSGSTDVQMLVNAEARLKRSAVLKKERDEFMSELKATREAHSQIEDKAAIKIQARFRGYRRRRGKFEPISKEDKNFLKARKPITILEELYELADRINLKPIRGLNLINPNKKTVKQKRLENKAAYIVQNFCRMADAKYRVRLLKEEILRKKQNIAAEVIQRFFKYIVFQTKLEGVVAMLKKKGAVAIQTVIRRHLACKRYFDKLPRRLLYV
jgi:hypothetical protein